MSNGYESSDRKVTDLRPPPRLESIAQVDTNQVGVCPVCGSYSASILSTASPLLAVCDVLVVRALEVAGKRIVRAERSRYRVLGTRPWHVAHTIWRPTPDHVHKSLTNAWDVVPAMLDSHGCCGVTSRQVTEMLDEYATDLLITGTAHNLTDLRYRFEAKLNISIPEPEHV